MKIPMFISHASRLIAVAGFFVLACAGANANVIFQADFNGSGSGTGGTNDLVTTGGTGAIVADGVNTAAFVTNANPFGPGAGNYLEVQRLTATGGGDYNPVVFNFASATNSWAAFQGLDILNISDGNYYTSLNGAFDVFFRVNSSTGLHDLSGFRPVDLGFPSPGGANGLEMSVWGQQGAVLFALRNPGFNMNYDFGAFNLVTFQNAYGGVNTSMDVFYSTFGYLYETLVTNQVYHVAFSLSTDTNGLITSKFYWVNGTGAIDLMSPAAVSTFTILASNLLSTVPVIVTNADLSTYTNGTPTDVAFTNTPWNFGASPAQETYGAVATAPFVVDYASPRIYDSVPTNFSRLPGITNTIFKPGLIFEADFKGPGEGTGGSNDLVTLGGTGVLTNDANVVGSVQTASPLGDGGYLNAAIAANRASGTYDVPVTFTFASVTNSFAAWQGDNIVGQDGVHYTSLNGAFDMFIRPNSTWDGANMFYSIYQNWGKFNSGALRLDVYSQWNGFVFFLQTPNGVSTPMFTNIVKGVGTVPQTNATTVSLYTGDAGPVGFTTTAGGVYHLGFTLSTDTNGVITFKAFYAQGTNAIDTAGTPTASVTFQLLASLVGSSAFTSGPWGFGEIVNAPVANAYNYDVDSVRLYSGDPGTFKALGASLMSPPVFLPPVVSGGQLTLSWTGSASQLLWATNVLGPWTAIPVSASPYSEAVIAGQNRFYRLQQ